MGGKLLGGRKVSREEARDITMEFATKYEYYIEKYEICGSYRRGKDELGDIDLVIVVSKDKILQLGMEIQKEHDVPWSHKRKSILYNGVQLEVHICQQDHLGAMLLYATGSGGYNAELRLYAAERGYKLNRYGLWAEGIRIAGRTETSIYEALGKPWKEPEDRS